MGLKSDGWIRRMALEHKMIEPFTDGQKRDGVISYGTSSYGYDIRVADEYQDLHQRLFRRGGSQSIRYPLDGGFQR